MSELLIRRADHILTMDDNRSELAGADILIRDGVIAEIGAELRTSGEVIEARGCVVTPGLVNTHHHLFQTLTRAVPGGQDALLFGWLGKNCDPPPPLVVTGFIRFERWRTVPRL